MKIKTENYNKGKKGEEIAKFYLENKGFVLIEQNYKNVIGEIDLIMSQGEWLIFIEVKLKIGDQFGTPEEMIGKRKLAQIRRIADVYLCLNSKIKSRYEKYRIDAVCIVINNDDIERISHYENLY